MKKYIFLSLTLSLLTFTISAQKLKDAIYLKNGSIIYGKLIEVSDDKYKIETPVGIMIYSAEEVDKFVKENPVFTGRRDTGVGFALEAGLLIGSQSSQYPAPFSFNFIMTYTTGTKNVIGAGSGIEFLGSAFAPVFIEYKHLFNEKKTSPFIFMRGGALIHTGGDNDDYDTYPYDYSKRYKGGPTFGLGTGISWAKEDFETYLSFGYRYALTSYRQNDYNHIIYTYKNNYNRLEVKFGFKF